MIRIALAVVAAVGLTFAADAQTGPQIGPLCQTLDGNLVVCHSRQAGGPQIGPLCQTLDGHLVVCRSGQAQIGPLCQTPEGNLVVCRSGRG